MQSAGDALARVWKGSFWYLSDDEIYRRQQFTMSVNLKNGSFSGEVEEDVFSEITGGEKVAVRGFIEYDLISFVKRYPFRYISKNGQPYIDRTQRGHEVTYQGYFDENEGKWEGHWEVSISEEWIRGSTAYMERFIRGFWEMSSN